MYLEPKGRNWGDVVNWDDLGKLYAAVVCVWTFLLLAGIIWLFLNRQRPHIRIRNLPLAIGSTLFLHVYLIKIFLAYTTNGHFLCSAEFWIMSIYLPFGIALFQAYLTQLRSLWEQQQQLVRSDDDRQAADAQVGSKFNLVQRWKGLSRLNRSYLLIAMGMLVQLILTATLYADTPTLQGDWSSYGKIPHAKGQGLCRKSLPWVTSAFWQLFWSWIYGPYTLFQIRHIRDIHYWRFQVIVSVIAGLPGTPLWLSALYLPQFKPVNMRWVPPMWLAPGIIIMQAVTVFVPMYETWSSSRDGKKNPPLLLSADSGYATSSYQDSMSTSTPKLSAEISMPSNSDTRVYGMPALRAALLTNSKPLLEFAATKEFSAENILFLARVRDWRSAWSTASRTGQISATAVAYLFRSAVDIYIDLIDERTADFPINIESKIKDSLDTIFQPEAAQRSPQSKIGMFDFPASFQASLTRKSPVRVDSSDSEKTLWDKSITNIEPLKDVEVQEYPVVCGKPENEEVHQVTIPAGFGGRVFDDAEHSIEYLVLTNTWRKFVKFQGQTL